MMRDFNLLNQFFTDIFLKASAWLNLKTLP
jgi:hypothetical protein